MRRFKQPTIYSDIYTNEKGEPLPIVLTPQEKAHAEWTQKLVNDRFGNALGYEVSITTLTAIAKKVSEQKLYQVAPADYFPIRVGEGTWQSNITTFRSFDNVGPFEDGVINTADSNSRLAVGDAAVDALNIPIINWAKDCSYSIFALEEAAKSGNWDLVSAKEKARKRNWDLGVQKVAFLGLVGQNIGSNAKCLGGLNQPTGQFDTTLVTAALNTLDPAGLSTFQGLAIQRYRANCNYTAFPTHFIIPESDYNGLMNQASSTYPIKSKLDLLLEGFKGITQNPKFKIMPSSYAMASNAGGSLNPLAATGIYTFLNYDEESLVMNIPLDYTNTLANSINNFQFNTAGYGQFTGMLALRPQELYYAGY